MFCDRAPSPPTGDVLGRFVDCEKKTVSLTTKTLEKIKVLRSELMAVWSLLTHRKNLAHPGNAKFF
jgi:hypothetical protein